MEVFLCWTVSPSDIHYAAISAVCLFACHECSGVLGTKSSIHFLLLYCPEDDIVPYYGHYTSQALSTPGREEYMPGCAHTAQIRGRGPQWQVPKVKTQYHTGIRRGWGCLWQEGDLGLIVHDPSHEGEMGEGQLDRVGNTQRVSGGPCLRRSLHFPFGGNSAVLRQLWGHRERERQGERVREEGKDRGMKRGGEGWGGGAGVMEGKKEVEGWGWGGVREG